MSYMALYRKWRPDEFEDVKGQEHIVTTLRNQINANRVGHAYLFCGTRGTGKTTIAKLFAKAVNCEQPVDGSPCNHCATCKAIGNMTSMNVIEIDAASNNGVDNIREIREEVQYSPAEGKYKVYIIDEVHMLSIGAFNALLKTLEEPPAYVIFILATTEAHKIPITILSRCQRYDFKRITIDTISDRLMDLMVKEEVTVEEKAIRYIAKSADGSMRDALSLLDQCIAFYLGKELTYDNVLEVLGAVDTTVFSKLLRSLTARDTVSVMKMMEDIVMQGRELSQFVTDFTWYLRNVLLVQSSDGIEDVLDMSSENILLLKEEAKRMEAETLMRDIRIFSELSNQVKYATQKRVVVELALIKLCKPQMETNLEGILERVRDLEDKIKNGKITQIDSVPEQIKQPVADIKQQSSLNIEEELVKRFPPAEIEELKRLIGKWSEVKKSLTFPLKGYIDLATVTISDASNSLNLSFPNDANGDLAKCYLERGNHLKDLKELLANKIGKEVQLQCIFKKAEQRDSFDSFDLSKLNIPIEYEND